MGYWHSSTFHAQMRALAVLWTRVSFFARLMAVADFTLRCVASADGVPRDPCGSVDGVALSPILVPHEQLIVDVGVFGWAVGLVLGMWVVGLVVGSMLAVLRMT